MSRGFNYAKVNLQKRVGRESYLYDSFAPTDDSWMPNPQKERNLHTSWMPVYFPKHKGKTLAEILFDDPSYIYFLYNKNVIFRHLGEDELTQYQKALAHQLEVLYCRAKRIRASKGHEFLIVVDRKGCFRRFLTVPSGGLPKKPLRNGAKITKRCRLLDVELPSQYKNPRHGFERMARCLRKLFFEVADYFPSAEEAGEVLMDDTKFDLGDCVSHRVLPVTERDHEILKQRYLMSVGR